MGASTEQENCLNSHDLWLHPIPEDLREMAIDELKNRDAAGFLRLASNTYSLDLVYWNIQILIDLRIYEEALLKAFTASRTNNHTCPLHELSYLFKQADRGRLRAAGESLPGVGPFTIFRGVAGKGPARRVRGFSWTGSLDRARWFANRWRGLADPAVYQITVAEADVLAYVNESGRSEDEFIIMPPVAKPTRLRHILGS